MAQGRLLSRPGDGLVDDHKADPKKEGDVAGGGLNPRRWASVGYDRHGGAGEEARQRARDENSRSTIGA